MTEKKIYNKYDVMKMFDISSPTLTRWIKEGKIPAPFKYETGTDSKKSTSPNRWRKAVIDAHFDKITNQTTNP